MHHENGKLSERNLILFSSLCCQGNTGDPGVLGLMGSPGKQVSLNQSSTYPTCNILPNPRRTTHIILTEALTTSWSEVLFCFQGERGEQGQLGPVGPRGGPVSLNNCCCFSFSSFIHFHSANSYSYISQQKLSQKNKNQIINPTLKQIQMQI